MTRWHIPFGAKYFINLVCEPSDYIINQRHTARTNTRIIERHAVNEKKCQWIGDRQLVGIWWERQCIKYTCLQFPSWIYGEIMFAWIDSVALWTIHDERCGCIDFTVRGFRCFFFFNGSTLRWLDGLMDRWILFVRFVRQNNSAVKSIQRSIALIKR